MTSTRNQRRRFSAPLRGFTLVEVLLGATAGAILLAGLASSIYVASHGLHQQGVAHRRAANWQLDQLTHDLEQALSFSERTDHAVSMTVPDRDGNGLDDTIRYAWSGTPGDPLTYYYNGAGPEILIDSVHAFSLNSTTRQMRGTNSPPVIGYDEPFEQIQENLSGMQVATRVAVNETGTLTTITARVDSEFGNREYRFAIYADDQGEPGALIAESGVGNQNGNQWKTQSIPPTLLPAGWYWLAIGLTDDAQGYAYQPSGGQTRHATNGAVQNGFLPNWPAGSSSSSRKVSIYGEMTPGG